MQDLRLALRSLARNPGFTAVALLTLALGIGFSTSSFSMANAFLLRNVPYPDAENLVRLYATTRQTDRGGHAPGNLLDVRAATKSFAALALYNGDLYSLGEPGQPAEQVNGLAVTPDFFALLGVQPFLGRAFTAEDAAPDPPTVAILSHRSWIRRFGGDRGVIGRTLRINAQNCTVIGVLPAHFDAPIVWGPVELLVPRTIPPNFLTNRRDTWMQAVGRLKPGVSRSQAQAELATLAAQLEKDHPAENTGRGLRVVDLAQSNLDGVTRSLLWLMTGLSVAMLLIACANLASLQVARAFVRSREFAVRAALGGSRRQLMSPLLAESLLLASLGGIASLLVAAWTNDIIGSLLLINNEPGFDLPVDGRVLAFAAASSLLSGLAFGLAPAWLAGRSPAAEALKEGSRSATGSPSHQRLKQILIVAELGLALTLVAVAAAFGIGARSFFQRQVGWNMDGVFTGFLALPYAPYGDNARANEFYRQLLPKLAAIPGVEQAALCRNLPLFALGSTQPVNVEGQPVEEAARRPTAQVGTVTAGYFRTLEIPLKAGAFFAPDLAAGDPPVAIVNEAFARRFWPGQDAVGRRVRLGDNGPWLEIVGVVGDTAMLARLNALDTPLQLYRPLVQSTTRYMSIVLRTSVVPESVAKTVREVVASLDADLPVAQPGSLRASYERFLGNFNLVIVNLAISAGMGLLIAAIGLFGVISQLTSQRTRDIGVRMALGASRGDIQRMILGEGARLLLVGTLLGIPAYYALTIVLARALPAMTLPGPWLLLTTIAVLAATMVLACWLPAQRATRINPVDALRAE